MRRLLLVLVIGCGGRPSTPAVAPAPGPATEPAAAPASAPAAAPASAPAADEPRAASHPRVHLIPPNIVGDYDRHVLLRTVKDHLPELRACYEKALVAEPELAGTLTVQFFLAKDRGVVNPTVGGAKSPELESCIIAAFQAISFPPPQTDGVMVNQILDLKPR